MPETVASTEGTALSKPAAATLVPARLAAGPVIGTSAASGSLVGTGLVIIIRKLAVEYGWSGAVEAWFVAAAMAITTTLSSWLAFYARRISIRYARRDWEGEKSNEVAYCRTQLASVRNLVKAALTSQEALGTLASSRKVWEQRLVEYELASFPHRPWAAVLVGRSTSE